MPRRADDAVAAEEDIASSSTSAMDEINDARPLVTPLPKLQLFSVSMIQLAEPITGLVIYPFINQFIRETGITKGDDAKSGYYAGVVESTFFFSEALTVVQWGYLSDRYGRRPTLLVAPVGLALAMLVFGMSTTFWPILVSRFFQGIFNGNIGISKSVVAEITDPTNRADAYAFMPMVWSLGQITGPLIGGVLSHPAERWPDTFGHVSYLRTHPYFLPCAVAGFFALITFAIAFVGLKETLPALVAKEKKKHARYQFSDDRIDSMVNEDTPLLGQREDNAPNLKSIFVRPVIFTLINHFCLTFVDMCHFALLVLFYSTPIPLGGLGLNPFQIGTTMGIYGCFNAFVQLKFLGRAIRKFGAIPVYSVAYSAIFFCLMMYPFLTHFAKKAGQVDAFVIVCMIIQLSLNTVISMAYGALQVVLVESVPEGGPLGTVNGLAQMLGSGSRTIAPTFASSLFSISVQRNLVGGNLVYYILMSLALVGISATSLLRRPISQ